MSDHTTEKYSSLSGGARKRLSDSSDTTLEGECKRRGCRTALDRFLLQRQNDIRNGETNPSHVESNSSRSPLSGIDNVQMPIAATATLEVQRKNNTRPPLSVIDNIQTPVTAAIRRRRGPNINSLFEAGSLRISDNLDKENRLRARSRTGHGPSLPDQFCMSHKNKESLSNAMSTPLCEVTNNASPDTLESCVSTGSAQSAVAPVKRKGSVRGLSIEKQLRNLEEGRPSHVNTPTRKKPIGEGQIRRGRGPSIATLLDSGKKRVELASRRASRIPAYSCVINQDLNTGSSVDNQNNDYTATSGVKNLFATFNEADDQRQAVDENDQTGFLPIEMWKGYLSLGPPSVLCSKCKALMWNLERNNKSNMNAAPTFSLCCKNGAVLLPPEELPPEPLASLLNGGSNSAHFRQNIRVYNSMFAMCSSGGKIDHRINKGGAPYCFKIRGMNMHFIGSLLPPDGEHPKFCQLYIYDTDNELSNRLDIVGASRDQVNIQIVRELSGMLDQHNKLVRYFRTARERFKNKELEEFKLILISSYAENGRLNIIGPSNEVAGLIVNPDADTSAVRDVVVETRHEGLKRVFETDAFFMQLQFPLLFPFGTDGYHREIPLVKTKNTPNQTSEDNHESELDKKHRECVSMKEYYCSKLMIRPSEALTPHLGGRLWQQYVVDSFTAMEQYRLDWISRNQTTIRSDLYTSVRDAVRRGDNDPSHVGKCVVLPASFTGSKRYMSQYFKDSLALCRSIGHPTLFLTMTTNTKWPEITEMMKYLPGVDVADAPDVTARVFKLKLDQLIDLIKKKNYFGKCIGLMHVIEFQKRGLPHAHMLIWLHDKDKPKSIEDIDTLVSAEIPDPEKDKIGHEAVKNYMIHGPCGKDKRDSPCMVNDRCSRHFPKKFNGITCFDECGFPVYRRRRTGIVVKRKGSDLDNRFVVPYNRDLLLRFQCHINVEICNNSRSLKYLFKYCLKGHDNATMLLKKNNGSRVNIQQAQAGKQLDEVKHYLDGRYVCASEAAWRIFGFDIHSRWPSVDRLPIHMPDNKYVSFRTGESLQQVCNRADTKRSKLEGWFIANKEIPAARDYTYAEFPQYFTWLPKECKWKIRQRGEVVGRLSEVHATAGELLYLRMLLTRQKGATKFEDIRTYEGTVYDTFKDTCSAMGLLRNDNQWHDALTENAHTSLPHQLREMFVNILAYCSVSDTLHLWNNNWKILSEDILIRRRQITGISDLTLSDTDCQNYALADIEKLLSDMGRSLKDFPSMPYPSDVYMADDTNRLIAEEMSYDTAAMQEEHEAKFSRMNVEQRDAYESIVDSVYNKKGGVFFVHGSGGCGKTFLWQTIISRLRADRKIVLPVASSGIAATLLPGGRTAHSRFRIPLKLDQHSTAGIKHGTDLAELIQKTDLIIWDEAPMQHRYAFEAVDRSLKDIMSAVDSSRSKEPFGGITVVFGGDYRQILPVIPKAGRAEIVSASLNRSRLWLHATVHLLKVNMRLRAGNNTEQTNSIREFSDWQLKIGDGKIPHEGPNESYGEVQFTIPERFLIHSSDNPMQALVEKIYPDFEENISSPEYIRSRAILTPTNVVVDDINNSILDRIPGETYTYFSQDAMEDPGNEEGDFDESFPVEYLNSLNMPCIPKHEMKIKISTPVMLMRNLNQITGLCNGTRMIVTGCKKNSIECQIITGTQVGSKHLIPRIDMIPTDTIWPFEFKRTQFPLQICFAMTINKSQGQSLDTVGLYLPRPVFCHGQFYVAISRVTSPDGLHIMIVGDDGTTKSSTKNVVFEEVFYNIPIME